jgi:predicted aspartyl protease
MQLRLSGSASAVRDVFAAVRHTDGVKSLFQLLLATVVPLLAACNGADLQAYGPQCRVERKAELPLAVARNFLLTPVKLEGRTEWMVVDTGAETSLLTPEAAEGLALDAGHTSDLLGVAGMVHSQNVMVRRFEIGGIAGINRSFGVGQIGMINAAETPVAGLLGTDVLSQFDVELDVPGRRMAFYMVSGCNGFVPWGGTASAIPVRFSNRGLTFLPLRIDDRPVRALLDTGARVSLMTRRVASNLGVTAWMLEADPERGGTGVGMNAIELRQHRFDSVALGPVTIRDMAINVADLRLPGVEMLLGADWIGPRRVWISYSDGAIFVR